MQIFETLAKKNNDYYITWLLEIFDEKKEYQMFLTNNYEDFEFNGKTYKYDVFTYKSNASKQGVDGGGILRIENVDNNIIELVESQKQIFAIVTGLLVKGIEKEVIYKHLHKWGKPSVERGITTINFIADDRLMMTFPSLVFSTQNNRGNF